MAIQHLFGIIGDSNYLGNARTNDETAPAPQTQIGGNAVSDPIPPASTTFGSPWPLLAQFLNDDYGILSDFRSRSRGSTGMVDHIDNGKDSAALVNIVSDLAALSATYEGQGDTVRKYVWCNWGNFDHKTTKATSYGESMGRYRDCIEYAQANGCGYVIAGNTYPRLDMPDLDETWHERVGLKLIDELKRQYSFDANVLTLSPLSSRLGTSQSSVGAQIGDNAHWTLSQCRSIARRWSNEIAAQLIGQGV
jgi:hypothetical protein